MKGRITITVSDFAFQVELNDSAVAAELEKRLPLEARMSRWGDEYYGSIGLDKGNEPGVRDELEVGEIAYWPTGDALCIFFGPTPVSRGEEPRAASAVVPLGRVAPEASLTEVVKRLRAMPGSVHARIARTDQ